MIVRVAVLLTVWVALWGEVSVANVVTGLVTGAVMAVLFPSRPEQVHRLRPLGALRFAGFMVVNLITSSWRVVLAVLFPTPERVATAVLPVRLTSASRLVASIVANSITLTPGTLTVDHDPDTSTLRVHVLGRVDPDAFAAEILDLERRVLAAVGEGTR